MSRTAEDYRSAVVMAATAAKLLAGLDVPGLLEDIERAEAVGPIVDPTLYRDKAKAMGEDRELLCAALPLHKMGQRMMAAAEAQS